MDNGGVIAPTRRSPHYLAGLRDTAPPQCSSTSDSGSFLQDTLYTTGTTVAVHFGVESAGAADPPAAPVWGLFFSCF